MTIRRRNRVAFEKTTVTATVPATFADTSGRLSCASISAPGGRNSARIDVARTDDGEEQKSMKVAIAPMEPVRLRIDTTFARKRPLHLFALAALGRNANLVAVDRDRVGRNRKDRG